MNYDFETMSDRWTSGSEKYEAMRRVDPEADASAIPLSMADMEFKLAPEIGKAMKHYIDNYPMGYNCPTDGYLDAVKLWMQSRHGWEIDKEWILPMPGVLVGMYAAIRALTNPGDGIIICSPVFGLFQAGIEGNGRIRPEICSVDCCFLPWSFRRSEQRAIRKGRSREAWCS